MKQTKGFGLLGVIVVIVITAIISSVATGVIMLNSNSPEVNSIFDLSDDKALIDFIGVYQTLTSKYYDEIDKEAMLKAAEEGMVNFLGEKYTTYLTDEEYNKIIDDLKGTYNGIGVKIDGNKIVSVTTKSPAEKVGLQVDDLIVKVNGIVVENLGAAEITALIKNQSKTVVNLEINRNGVLLNYTVEKEDIVNTTISYEKLENTNIGYIYIRSFSQNLKDQVSDALKDLEKQGIKSLIIDVRNNVGGYLSAAEETASLFLQEGKRIYSLEANGNKYNYNDKTKEKRTYPVAILINKNSASASEILAAALKDSYKAILVGENSYGKGKVQQIISLASGDSVKYTSAKWLTPNGECIDGIGLHPDHYVSNNVTGIDSQLNKAIEVLGN